MYLGDLYITFEADILDFHLECIFDSRGRKMRLHADLNVHDRLDRYQLPYERAVKYRRVRGLLARSSQILSIVQESTDLSEYK